MGLFVDIFVPATPVLARLEQRGLPLDETKREEFRATTLTRLRNAEARIEALVQEFHGRRIARIAAEIERLEGREVEAAVPEPCEKHPAYRGLTKRAKCEGCARVFAEAAPLRAETKDYAGRVRAGKALLKRLGPTFQPRNDHHWRWLLFDKTGLGLKPVGFTGKKRMPKVDDDAIEKLQRKHPEVEVLKLRVAVKQSEARLTRRLGMFRYEGAWHPAAKWEPDAAGRIHFAYNAHRSNMCRLSSGADESEDDKSRESPGNGQNIPHPDRAMYAAPPGWVMLELDWSQIEARGFAWIADETEMLEAWKRGLDIHTVNALEIAKALGVALRAEDADTTPFPGDPQKRSFRHAGKLTHKLHYGMGAEKFSNDYNIPLPTCQAIITAYYARWNRLRPFQAEEVARATAAHVLRNEFGAKLWFTSFERDRRTGEWVLGQREEALAFRSQSNVACMCLACLPRAEQIAERHGGELLATTHDSFLLMVPDVPEVVNVVVAEMRVMMERPWPEMGTKVGFGEFRCPVDVKAGYNWGPFDAEQNPRGLKKLKREGVERGEVTGQAGATGAQEGDPHDAAEAPEAGRVGDERAYPVASVALQGGVRDGGHVGSAVGGGAGRDGSVGR